MKVTTAMWRELVQLWSSFCLISGGAAPPRLAAHLWLSATFQLLHGSPLLQTVAHLRCPNSFLLLPTFQPSSWLVAKHLPCRWLSRSPEGRVYPTSALRLQGFQIALSLCIWLHPDMGEKNLLKLQQSMAKLMRCVIIGPSEEEGYKTINTV